LSINVYCIKKPKKHILNWNDNPATALFAFEKNLSQFCVAMKDDICIF
jgi:hypothetical protein